MEGHIHEFKWKKHMMTINKVWVKKDIFYWVSSACYSWKRSTLSLYWDVFQTSLQTKLITTSNFGLRKLWNLLVHIYGHLRVDESKRCNQDGNDKCLLKSPLFKNNCILQIYICITYWNMQVRVRNTFKLTNGEFSKNIICA